MCWQLRCLQVGSRDACCSRWVAGWPADCPSLCPPAALVQPAYINYLDIQIGPQPLTSYFGQNVGWLEAVKTKVDPTGFWTTTPLSIPGAGGSSPAPAPAPAPTPSTAFPAPASPAPAPAPVPSAGTAAGLQGVLLLVALLLLGASVLA